MSDDREELSCKSGIPRSKFSKCILGQSSGAWNRRWGFECSGLSVQTLCSWQFTHQALGRICVLSGPNITLIRLLWALRYLKGPCLWAWTFQVYKERATTVDECSWLLCLSNRYPNLNVPDFGPL